MPQRHLRLLRRPLTLVYPGRMALRVPRLPAPLRTLTGPAVRYMQEGSFDKRSGRYHWQTFPSRMADRLHLEGSVRIESGEDRDDLSKADSGTYRADVPHAIINTGKGAAVVFLVVIYR